MSIGQTHQAKTMEDGLVYIMGSFAPNGSSAVDATKNKGSGFTVARTSTGLFTITFDALYPNYRSFTATLQLASGDDKYCQIGTYTASAGTLTIRVWDVSGAAVADVAANDNNRINFCAVFASLT